jgi:creatinine amidohydrolase
VSESEGAAVAWTAEQRRGASRQASAPSSAQGKATVQATERSEPKAQRWAETDRETLRRVLPDAVVLLPIGATEQHGRHLATGTDALLAATTCERAADAATGRSSRPLVLAPPLAYGASDHHLEFGGTLSLSAQTLLTVLLDVARSVSIQGGRRLVVVNGHGGNVGVCQTFAAIASTRHELAVAYLNYWRLAPTDLRVPGHAGEFETSLMLAVRPDLVAGATHREPPQPPPAVADVEIHSAEIWRSIDGYTDHPERADAEQGKRWLDTIVGAMADRFVELAGAL